MRPEITNNNSGKSPYALAIEANNKLNILEVVIMMWMTCASFKQFYEKVDMSMI